MNREKRQLSLSESTDEDSKKLRVTSDKDTKSITNVDDLSNELFYEIFDYLDGCGIFKAFSNINTRFQDLINSSAVLLKIKLSNEFDSIVRSNCKQIIIPNQHRIISLHLFNASLIDTFYTQCAIDLFFSRLESLVFSGFIERQIVPILSGLTDLPRLYSLTIVAVDNGKDLHAVYQQTFTLPRLKYFKLCLYHDRLLRSSEIMTNKLSTIEHLVTDHSCTLRELVTMLSCTRRLCHLTCRKLSQSDESIRRKVSMAVPNLTHIKIYQCYISFDELEILIKQISSQLRVLDIRTSFGTAYLDANRWKRLISEYIPHLYKLNLRNQERFTNDFNTTAYRQRIKQFTSSFWIQRQWSFEILMDFDDSFIHGSSFSIRIQKSNRQKLDIVLIVHFFQYPGVPHPLDGYVLNDLQFTHLVVNDSKVSIMALAELIRLFHSANSLTVQSLAEIMPGCLSDEDEQRLRLISNDNEITKLNLVQTAELTQVAFIMALCPRIKYLQMECPNATDLQLIVRFILMQHAKHLVSLYLRVSTTNNEMVDGLQRMIDVERLLDDYTIERLHDRIHLQWK